jgi:hypothetical protein
LIVATICTESGGRADAFRLEPGYISDEKTPNKVSPGLMQTLISTARDVLQMSVDRAWLLEPAHAIEAGTAYIARQSCSTRLDPPLVAAAYNAGRLAHQSGSHNRWKLRQYPLGTSAHCDRFVAFFNDAVAVLATHAIRPSVGIDVLLGSEPAKAAHRAGSRLPQVKLAFGPHAHQEVLSPYSIQVLESILQAAGLASALVSSTSRTPAEQARVMFDNLERQGVAAQRRLYRGKPGEQVIDVYERSRAAGQPPDEIKRNMEVKIKDLGPGTVSRHAADPRTLNVADIAPSSVDNPAAFEKAVRRDTRVARFLTPGDSDPAYHLEIPQPVASAA